MNRCHCRLLLCVAGVLSGVAQAALPSRSQVDGWLQQMGIAIYDAAKGVNWGVMPGPFYTLNWARASAPPSSVCIAPILPIRLAGIHAVAERLFQLHRRFWRKPAKLRFFAQDRWRFFLTGALSDTPTYYWGQGFAAGDKDSHKQAYTAQVLDLQPMLYRRLVNNIYLGVGWTLDVQHAAQIDEDDPPRIQHTAQGGSSLSNGGSVEISWDDRDFIPNPRKGSMPPFAIPTSHRTSVAIRGLMNTNCTIVVTMPSMIKMCWHGNGRRLYSG